MALWEREFDRISADWISGLTENPNILKEHRRNEGKFAGYVFFLKQSCKNVACFFLAAKIGHNLLNMI